MEWSHICARITDKNDWGARETVQPRVPALQGKEINLKTSGDKKLRGVCGTGRNSQPQRQVHWRDPQGPRMYTNPPTWESAPEGPNLLVGSGGSE